MARLERAYFNRFFIDLTRAEVRSIPRSGAADDAVAELVGKLHVSLQLDRIGAALVRDELREYGAWDEKELSDDQQNRHRIGWLATGNIREEVLDR